MNDNIIQILKLYPNGLFENQLVEKLIYIFEYSRYEFEVTNHCFHDHESARGLKIPLKNEIELKTEIDIDNYSYQELTSSSYRYTRKFKVKS